MSIDYFILSRMPKLNEQTVPMLLFPDLVEFNVVRLTLAGFIGVVGFAVARG